MKIAFIRPKPSPLTIGLQYLMVVEPLELEIMATLIRDEHEAVIVDMILEKKSLEQIVAGIAPQVVCLTGYITHIPVIIDYCRRIRQHFPGIITIVGGVHIEKFPEDVNDPSVDYRVVRNATRTFPRLIGFLAKKTGFPSGVLRTNESLDESALPDYDFYVPLPDRSLTNIYRHRYFYVFHNRVALIKTSFGCPFTCNFCFCREITGNNYFERPLPEVMEELKSIREKEIYIVDDDFLLNPRRINDFLGLLRQMNIKKRFLVYGRADFIVAHPGLMKDFRDLGLRTVIVGLESFYEEELAGFDKKTTGRMNREAMAVLNQNGIDCYAAIIISPSWTKEDFARAARIMQELRIKFVNLQPLTPLKGINLNVDESKVVLKRDEYEKWDLAHVAIMPDHMSISEFYMEVLKLYRKTVLHPFNLLSHMKYPVNLQWRMIKGVIRVNTQYKTRIMESQGNA